MDNGQPNSPRRFNRPALHLLLVAILGILVYSNTLSSPFVFDDEQFIMGNPLIRDFNYFTDTSYLEDFDSRNLDSPLNMSVFRRRLVSFFTFALNHRANGLEVRGYNTVNIAIHISNALLLYLLVLLTFRTPHLANSSLKETAGSLALVLALLFVCHPLQTQAVNYISQRFTLLATFFYLLSISAFAGSRLSSCKAASFTFYALAFISAALGMLSKEITFTLPVIIALYEAFFFKGPVSRRAFRVLPFMLTMLIVPYILLSETPDIDQAFRAPTSVYSRWEYLITQFAVIVTYIRLLFIPINQNLDYDNPLYGTFIAPQVFLSFLLLVSLLSFAFWFYLRTRKDDGALRLIPFGFLWFLITLSVTSSIVPTANLLFEHRVYLPSAGVFLTLTTAVFLFMKTSENKKRKATVVFSLILITVTLSYASYARNSVWKNKITLWEDVVSKSPRKARGHNNLGEAYLSNGFTDKAIAHLQIALRLKPEFAVAHINLANAYFHKGLTDSALNHYTIAIRLRPGNAKAYNNIGIVFGSIGLNDKAIEHLQTALRLKPDYVDAHYNIGVAYFDKGFADKAIEHFQAVLNLKTDSAEAYNNLAIAYSSKGSFDKAIAYYGIALRLKPDYADAHFNLGLVYLEKGDLSLALKEMEATLQIDPAFQKARQYLDYISK
jgi:tetratricopeptide (TPR) repeat protein